MAPEFEASSGRGRVPLPLSYIQRWRRLSSAESSWQRLDFGVDEEWIVEFGHVAGFFAGDRQQAR